MAKTTLIFGISLALLLIVLKWAEYLFFTRDLALEVYIGFIGAFCTVLGTWIGWQFTRLKTKRKVESEGSHPYPKASYLGRENNYNLSPREIEVLELIARGLSYQQIADQLSVSLSTVKTHASNIFSKMDVQRRTQAVMLAQKTGILHQLKV